MASQSPDLALQKAVFAVLGAAAGLAAAFPGGDVRIYDEGAVPADPTTGVITATFPYLTIGGDQIVPKTPQISKDAFAKIEAWSRATDYGEAKAILGAAEDALSSAIDLQGFNTVTWNSHGAMYRKEPDGVTRRGILTIAYTIATLVPLS